MKSFAKVKSSEICVGDIVLCYDEDTFAADLALLTSANDGDCFIKTSSIDGEKNLKKREQPKDLDKHFPKNELIDEQKREIKSTIIERYLKIAGDISIELPNKDLHSYKGILKIGNDEYSLGEN